MSTVSLPNLADIWSELVRQVKRAASILRAPDVVPVIRRDDITGPISYEMVSALNILDLRIRALNLPLFPTVFEKPSGMRSTFFKALYIPNLRMNPYYRLLTLRGMEMYVLQTTANNYLDFTGSRRISLISPKFENSTEALPVAILAGPPVKLTDQITLVFLAVEQDIEHNVVIDGKLIDVTKGINLTSEDTRKRLKEQLETIVKIYTPETEQYTAQLDQMCQDVSAMTESRIIPAVIKGPISQDWVLTNSSPGVSLSLLDIAYFSRVPFQGSRVALGIKENADATYAHSTGNAVDVSLAPFYAVTGYALKDNAPHVLDRDYKPTGIHQQLKTKGLIIRVAPTESEATASQVQTLGSAAAIINTNKVEISKIKLNITPVNTDESRARVQTVFSSLFAEAGVPSFYDDIINELSPTDQVWHHIESNMSPLPAPETPRSYDD